jgi:hypothetical protein
VRDPAGRTEVVLTPPQVGEARVRVAQDRFEQERKLAVQRKARKTLPREPMAPPRSGHEPSVPGRTGSEDGPEELPLEPRDAQGRGRGGASTSAERAMGVPASDPRSRFDTDGPGN